MDAEARLELDDVARIAEEVRAHERRDSLAALAFDVLSRQAEGRALFAGRKYVRARAKEHDVPSEHAASETGNLLTILQRGPDGARQRALVCAFAIHGLGLRLGDTEADERAELLQRFVRHADWLEVASPYSVYPFVSVLLDESTAAEVWQAVADAVAHEEGTPIKARAHNAARLTALASAGDPARAALERVARETTDPAVQSMARVLCDPGAGDASSPSEPPEAQELPRLAGRVGRAPPSSTAGVLRLVSGVAVLQWLLRGLGLLFGVQRSAELELIPGGVRAHRRTCLFGRLVRESEETHTLAALATVGRQVRYPALHLLVGALALSAGVLVGGLFAYDAVRSGETILLLIAAAAIVVGGGLDLGLSVLLPARRGRVAFDLRTLPRRSLRLVGVPQHDADRFLEALEQRIGEG